MRRVAGSVAERCITSSAEACPKCTGANTSVMVSTPLELYAACRGLPILMHGCSSIADGHGLKKATVEELRFLTAAGILRTCATNGTLVSLDAAIRACGMARVAAPVLAAMAGIPELQPTPAPPRQAQLLLIAPDSMPSWP